MMNEKIKRTGEAEVSHDSDVESGDQISKVNFLHTAPAHTPVDRTLKDGHCE